MKKYYILILLFAICSCKANRDVLSDSNGKVIGEPTQVVEVPLDPLKIDRDKIMAVYYKYKGVGYRYGGTDEMGFDCSGFVNQVYEEAFGIDLPRSTALMWNYGTWQTRKQPGDLVFFRPSDLYDHVGIYIGKGQFIHSSSSAGVTLSNLSTPYWAKSYVMTRTVR